MAEGIEVRVAKDGTKTYRASVWSARENKRIRRSFPTLAAARGWRADAGNAVKQGRLRAAQAPRLADAVEAWCDGARGGTIRTRGRQRFKPGTIRSVEQNYRLRLEQRFATRRLDSIDRLELQDLVDELAAGTDDTKPLNPATIETTILPLRLVYRRHVGRGDVAIDPTDGLELPQKRRGQRKPPSPADAAKLLAACGERDRALWGVAMLAGLRRGELMALRWDDVDLKAAVVRIHPERGSYDPAAGSYGTPKSRQGARTIPIVGTLAPLLRAHMLASGRRDGLVFGENGRSPFSPSAAQKRADDGWRAARLERVTLHACRHLYASLSIAAGVNAHALCTYMGHSSIAVTYDLYGHLFPGNEAEAGALLDAYLDRAFTAV